jgi:ribonuclease T1
MRINPMVRLGIVAVMALVVWFLRSQPNATTQVSPSRATPTSSSQATAPAFSSLIVRDQTIYDLNGRVAYRGDVDLRATLARIQSGQRDQHGNDGAVHRNREGKLPRQPDPNYYREYVVRTPKLRSVGPQRLIVGKGGEAYYTPDHYASFTRVK